ncbi:uncharacterized protein PHACADRAFT_201800 [Phanerochaete carnosa HHB-10118-sp]|uniref:Uncharacterized protein n=1 Tax=Phanerochaete carnosa (strain HHB-10118-sp) TaxID=650164 RepID=K5UII7_PHACS|nr:uncharacterized protein PHACADRAFT_201800 [Phanerochaete carnosa HHB-10118-sp]EKM49306.1 hypothetical protein PHACADRAFT_201800 [Phanerochaete carnosa HHB-10118-sp]
MLQQVLVGGAFLAVLVLKEGYELVRVYWLDSPDQTFAEIRIVLKEVGEGLTRLEHYMKAQLFASGAISCNEISYRGVHELKQEWHDCERLYFRLKHDLRRYYPRRWTLVISGAQLLTDIRDLRGRVYTLEQDWLRTSSVILYDSDPEGE